MVFKVLYEHRVVNKNPGKSRRLGSFLISGNGGRKKSRPASISDDAIFHPNIEGILTDTPNKRLGGCATGD
jgi:hypothetical protein